MTADHQSRLDELCAKALHAGDLLSTMKPPSHLAHVHSRARQLQASLDQACRRCPSTGFAGVFTTGKSMLQSLLLDLPGLLPVANVPSTGNITRVRVRPAAAGSRVINRAFTLLSPDAVARMVDFIVDGIVAAVDGNPAYDVRGLRGHTLIDVADPAASDWEPLEAFLSPMWTDMELNVQVRQWASELLAIRDALAVAAHLLPRSMPGNEIVLSEGSLEAALLIGDSRVPPAEFPHQRYRPPLAAHEMSQPHGLRVLLPLVHEVLIDVEMDRDIWSFNGMAVDLLDFPGLASGSLRDRFLAEEELATVTVLTVVLDAEKPRNDDVHRLYGLLEKGKFARPELAESVLVVANRFDRVLPPAGPVDSVARLAAESIDFRAVLVEADELTRKRPARVALTSTLTGAVHYGHSVAGARPQDLDGVRAAPGRWEPVMRRMAAANESHPLRFSLEAYLHDGGIGYMRELLSRHLVTHGRRMVVNEAEAIAAALDEQLELLRPVEPSAAPSGAERARIETLATGLTRACARCRDRLENERLVGHLPVGESTVDEQLLGLVVRAVHDWPLWPPTGLLARTRRVGTGRPETGRGKGIIERPARPPEAPRPGTAPAITTSTLLTAYRDTRTSLSGPTVALLENALRQWSAALLAEENLADVSRRLGGPDLPWSDDRTLLHDRLRTVTSPEWVDYRFRLIDTLLDPDLLVRRAREVRTARSDTVRVDPEPLAANRALPWHPKILGLGRDGLADFADPITVFRLRRDLVLAMHREIGRELQAVFDTVREETHGFLDQFSEDAVPTPDEIRDMTEPSTGGDA
ncbi:hypothetical protein JOF56_005175 [Kibdelosporangium banguiense]|uniref:Dynamin family protein n=1 Tax=Kibdelosporangium banguiense TaxID=1365924 RepID=A0ABS4TK41_9PSEU|nr:GTPase domain-containing protein [Kibdelosporangium banguiense]MBP2324790.1 hypothetical protein [Kibdelosporangium banguiense]